MEHETASSVRAIPGVRPSSERDALEERTARAQKRARSKQPPKASRKRGGAQLELEALQARSADSATTGERVKSDVAARVAAAVSGEHAESDVAASAERRAAQADAERDSDGVAAERDARAACNVAADGGEHAEPVAAGGVAHAAVARAGAVVAAEPDLAHARSTPDAPETLALDAARASLAALEVRGARAFDAASCDCARSLIARAATLDPRPSALLLARATIHVERLAKRFDAMRVVTEQRLAAAEQVHGSLPAEREAFERGELVSVRQTLRRLSSAPPPRAARAPLVRRERCAGDYQASLAELTAAVALARASDLVPEGAGPYNPLRIASDLLECIRAVSPIYLSSQLNRFEELTSMLALPALPEPPSKTTATGRPSPSKTTATGKASPSKPSRPSSAAPRASKPATKAAKARRRSA